MSTTATDPSPGASPQAAPVHRSAVRSLLRLWPFLRPVRVRFFSAALAAVAGSCLGLVIPLVLKWIVDGPVASHDPGQVWLGGLLLLVLGVCEAGLFGLRRWLIARPLASVEASMRGALYRHVQRLPVAFHDRWPSGQLLSRGTTDLQLLRQFLAFGLTFLVVNSATVVVGYLVLLSQRWTLGLLVLAPAVPLVILCSLFEVRYSRAARRAQDQVGDLTTIVEESVLGIRVVKGFGRHRSQARAFRDLALRLRGTELLKARLLGSIWAVIMTLPELALGGALVLGTLQVAHGDLSAGTLLGFLSTALTLRWPVESLGFLLALCNESATAADRYFEVMDEPEAEAAGTARDTPATAGRGARGRAGAPPRPAPAPPPPAAGEPGGGLVFEDVHFRYPDAPPGAPATLCGVDLHVRPGETMALVGATGSGKTTLTALVPRLYDVSAGRILLDGTDVRDLTRDEVRSRVAMAFEDPTLFSASVAENVLMGRAAPGGEAAAPADEADALARALRVVQAHAFVTTLADGTATQVGEQGLSLSGGQRQRLALARAVVGRPRFLILDDPLSALDVHTEAQVEAALREVLAATTALVVAHRPSTVQLADRVALLSGGRVVAVGTHRRLLRDNAEYARLMSGLEEPQEHRPPATETVAGGPAEGSTPR
ncbi:ABC transporter ATP-binding protein [Streptomyces sp. NPDC059740]|uniref:ABC transporter ATP-binding protein n=1 Tax=Streptomyces sp. NPDC059740 TaxID=3346926 RepID=UPI00365EA81A